MARNATISSIAWYIKPGQSLADGLEHATGLLRQAAAAKPDLIIFPELFLHAQRPIELWREAGPLPNALTDHFGALAREYHTNLVIPVPTVVNDRCFNSAVVLDRQGAIVGKYDKVHPTDGEVLNGIAPGKGPVVHQLDFGRIAHAICFDINLIYQAELLRDMDVDVICYHSMFAGGPLLNAWAFIAGAYLVSAYEEESHVIDMTGAPLMSMGRRYEQVNMWKLPPIMTARLNLDRRLFHVDYTLADYDGKHGGLHRLLADRPGQVTIDHVFPASVYALGALDGVTLPELCREYGLQPRNEYFRNAQELQAKAREEAWATA